MVNSVISIVFLGHRKHRKHIQGIIVEILPHSTITVRMTTGIPETPEVESAPPYQNPVKRPLTQPAPRMPLVTPPKSVPYLT